MINNHGKEIYGDGYFTVKHMSLSTAAAQSLLKTAG